MWRHCYIHVMTSLELVSSGSQVPHAGRHDTSMYPGLFSHSPVSAQYSQCLCSLAHSRNPYMSFFRTRLWNSYLLSLTWFQRRPGSFEKIVVDLAKVHPSFEKVVCLHRVACHGQGVRIGRLLSKLDVIKNPNHKKYVLSILLLPPAFPYFFRSRGKCT